MNKQRFLPCYLHWFHLYIKKKTVKVLHIKSYLQYKSCKEVNNACKFEIRYVKVNFSFHPLAE